MGQAHQTQPPFSWETRTTPLARYKYALVSLPIKISRTLCGVCLGAYHDATQIPASFTRLQIMPAFLAFAIAPAFSFSSRKTPWGNIFT